MKVLFKSIILFMIVLFAGTLISCGIKTKDSEVITSEKLPAYSEAILIEANDNNNEVFNLDEKDVQKVEERENTLSILYNKKSSTYVYSLKISSGANFNHNIIVINKDKKNTEVKDFYSALDLKLNPSGDFLAFRSFKKDSLDSAEGLRIYNINERKYINIKSKVLVSGNLYQWIDDNKIAYYGGLEGEKNSNKIYVYDLKENKESIYLDNVQGISTYFIPVNKNILFISMSTLGSNLNYYDASTGKVKPLGISMEKIYKSVVKDDNIFFIGSEDGINTGLYEFSSKTLSLNRITYDFPKAIDVDAGIALDGRGYVYFCGVDESQNSGLSEVYMYDLNSKSINLISTHLSRYGVGGSLYY